jgi:small conductance mechanosensitive channel
MQGLSADVAALQRSIDRLVQGIFASLPMLVIGLVVFVAFWLMSGVVRALIMRATADRSHANVGVVIGRLAQWAIIFVGLLVALSVVAPSVKPSNILSVLGVGGVAIGFAFKDILQNFVAGILLLLREPFRVGDQIIYKEFEGTVEDIDTRATLLRTYDGRRVIIPNGDIYTNAITVNTAFDKRRTQYDVGIGYGDDIDRARGVIVEAVRGVKGVLQDPAPDALVSDLAGSWINLRARWWTDPRRGDLVGTQDRVLTAIRNACAKANIDLPFPTQVTLFHDQTDANDGDRTKAREGWPAGENPPKRRNMPDAMERLATVREKTFAEAADRQAKPEPVRAGA